MGRAEGWTRLRTAALLVNAILLGVGNCANPLLTRLYFIGGGTRIWFSAWLQTAAWPVTFIPLLVSYLHHRRRRSQTSDSGEFQHITPFLFISAALIGLLMGLNNYLFTYGVSKLPVSTVLLIGSSQLGFTSVFAFFLVKQKFTAFTINAVILLTLSAVVLGVRAGNDRPAGESNKEYILGFASTAGSAALLGLVFPLVELSYSKAKKARIEYSTVLEFQMVLCFAATLVCTLGMFINHDFEETADPGKSPVRYKSETVKGQNPVKPIKNLKDPVDSDSGCKDEEDVVRRASIDFDTSFRLPIKVTKIID
ncbi:unnamed protein product [Cuscuta epithymum]|uniref:Probable purine permease n=1 Tax=Cuscuta epithymum TaxID=186058 RepID=A0AAV0F375_9ASTE|nr:unnamed protein product [Cuscuta epithymum]